MNIQELPSHILLLILRNLDIDDICLGVRQCCQDWRQISYDRALWRQLHMSMKHETLTDEKFTTALSQVCDYVEEIDVSGCQKLSASGIVHGNIFCPNLRRVNISCTRIDDNNLAKFVRKYPNVESVLCLRCCNLNNAYSHFMNLENLTEFHDPYEDALNWSCPDISEALPVILDKNKNLKAVRISNSQLADAALSDIEGHAGLTTFQITDCTNISTNCFCSLTLQLPSLTNIDISASSIRDSGLVALSSNCRQLKEVNISECRHITDIGICELVKNCTQIEILIVNDSKSYTANITNVGLAEIGEHCKGLVVFKMCFSPSVTDIGMSALASGCRRLEVLDITGNISLTDAAVIPIAEHCCRLRNLKASSCVQLTSRSINKVITLCLHLCVLEVETCHYLNKLNFDELATRKQSPLCEHFEYAPQAELRHLDLSYCSKISLDSVKQISTYCINLLVLSLQACYLLSDTALELVSEKCQKLQVLDISGGSFHVSKLTDNTLIAIARNCKSLTTLSINRNPLMTVKGVESLARTCGTLKSLCLTVGKHLSLLEVIYSINKYHKKCQVKDFNIDYVSAETKGNFTLTFPPLIGRWSTTEQYQLDSGISLPV